MMREGRQDDTLSIASSVTAFVAFAFVVYKYIPPSGMMPLSASGFTTMKDME